MKGSSNFYERDTRLLSHPFAREEIELIYKFSQFVSKKQYKHALDMFGKIKNFYASKGFNYVDSRLYCELQIQVAIIYAESGQLKQAHTICINLLDFASKDKSLLMEIEKVQYYNYLEIRLYTLQLLLALQGCQQINQKQTLNKLTVKLRQKQNNLHIREVLGKLTGCTNLCELVDKNIKIQQEDLRKKAKKLDLLAQWKEIVGKHEEAIQYKHLALDVWTKCNLLHESGQCKNQLNELLGNKQGHYIYKLKKLNYIVKEIMLIHIPPYTAITKIQPLVILGFPSMINKLRNQLQLSQDKRSKKGISESVLVQVKKTKQKITQYKENVIQFYCDYRRQINSQITCLLPSSKFIQEEILSVRKKMGIFMRLKNFQKRFFVDMLKQIKEENQQIIKDNEE